MLAAVSITIPSGNLASLGPNACAVGVNTLFAGALLPDWAVRRRIIRLVRRVDAEAPSTREEVAHGFWASWRSIGR